MVISTDFYFVTPQRVSLLEKARKSEHAAVCYYLISSSEGREVRKGVVYHF